MKVKVKLYLSYDGSNMYGWQRQKNADRTIQQIVEQTLSKICACPVTCTSSGRTDAGVHARIQVAHALIPEARLTLIENGRFILAVNSLLPRNIRLHKAQVVPESFHAQRDVLRKTYLYFVDTSAVQVPALRQYSWNLRHPLDWKAIEKATQLLVGSHDFKAFCDADSSVKTTTRTLFEAEWGRISGFPFGPSELRALRLTGNGFLKHMVRSITGTLVKVGEGKISHDQFKRALLSGNRKLVGPTAPPNGLWLWDILYLT